MALEDPLYRTAVDIETRKRIRVSILAYAYEMLDAPLVSDAEFDALAQSIDLRINTREPTLDRWFREHFSPSTGMWIRSHPELDRIARIYETHFRKEPANEKNLQGSARQAP